MPIEQKQPVRVYQQRRQQLIEAINTTHKDAPSTGLVVLFGGFEDDHAPFFQERSFYYLTGVTEPATALVLDLDRGTSTLYLPRFATDRSAWMPGCLTQEDAHKVGVDEIAYLGESCKGYQCHPFFTQNEYANLITLLAKAVEQKRTLFTLAPQGVSGYVQQRFIVQRLDQLVPGLGKQIVDISSIVAHMRRNKSETEIELLFKAIEITTDAHLVAARGIKPGVVEHEVQAALEYMFTFEGGSVAFPSIVASGKNSTVLHYHHNTKVIEQGDLVVVDIGAQFGYYCADLTRTYPASGSFTKRQREIYNHVLDTQDYIASLAAPGMYVNNPDEPDKSLNHLARNFLNDRGYGQYFNHGIGHYLGLDVHDVGDYKKPLEIGDVITIEPGIYIPEESCGVRIEDDYWIVKGGAICLSENLVRHPDEIERMMHEDTFEE